MKFIIALVALATSAVAFPTCASEERPRHRAPQRSFRYALGEPTHPPLCWNVCWDKEVDCPDGWFGLDQDEHGHCWTCCLEASKGFKH
ncbi:hypothetical protein ONZ45_g2361 [Pleurotus djamor]|nr:hypothetical protein ONZ45_g2361 [Pleurotus djamor]